MKIKRGRHSNPLSFENTTDSNIKFGLVISYQNWRKSSIVQLKDLIPAVKNHIALDMNNDRTISIDTTK